MVPTRRPTVASRTLAEQLRPVVDVHRAIQEHGYGSTDVENARGRAFGRDARVDAWALLDVADDLTAAFTQMATAFELSGMTSTSSLATMERVRVDPNASVLSWVNGESSPVDPSLRLARRVAGVVGNAILVARWS